MGAESSSLEKAFFAAAGEVVHADGESSHLGGAVRAEQLDLLRDPGTGKLPQNVFQLVREAGEESKRGPGRPKGAGNRRNDDLAKLYLSRFPDPVMAMGALANTPLDQFIETLLIAEGASRREDRLLGLIDRCEEMVAAMMRALNDNPSEVIGEKLDKLVDLVDRVCDMAKGLKMKPGDLGIKALNLQLAAHAKAAEYVHSKKAVLAEVNLGLDGVIVMPGAPAAATAEDQESLVQAAAAGIAKLLRSGRIDPLQLADFRLIEGQLVDDRGDAADDADDE